MYVLHKTGYIEEATQEILRMHYIPVRVNIVDSNACKTDGFSALVSLYVSKHRIMLTLIMLNKVGMMLFGYVCVKL